MFDNITAPFINIAYNDDNTIASTSQTTPEGEVRIQVDFFYENGRLVGKQETSDGFDEAFTYNYTDDGMLASGTRNSISSSGLTNELSSFEFTVDELGRVTAVVETNTLDGELVRDASIAYDAAGNIIAAEDFQDFTGLETQTNSTFDYAASIEPTVNLIGLFAALNDSFIPEFTLSSSN